MTRQQTKKPLIAIDIDDVTAGFTEHVRLWANQLAGVSLSAEDYITNDEYWQYYESIWRRHGLSEKLSIDAYLEAQADDQSDIPVIEGARETIQALKDTYDIVFLTARPSYQKNATRAWLDQHIDSTIPLYMAFNPRLDAEARSKGEICAELGASLLIDDHIEHCKSALMHGLDTILFGSYGWNENAPAHLQRCVTWLDVRVRLLHDD